MNVHVPVNNLNFHLLFQDVDEILKFIEGGKETKKERKNPKKERQRRDSGKREERIQRADSTKIKFSEETLASMQPTKTYIDPSNRVGDDARSKAKATPKDRANLELKRSGIEIDESEIDNGIITVTCHKSSALAAAQQAIKELEELRNEGKHKEDAVNNEAAVNSNKSAGNCCNTKSCTTWYDHGTDTFVCGYETPPDDKCVGHDHQHHGRKGGRPNKKDLNKPNIQAALRHQASRHQQVDSEEGEKEKIVEKVTVPDQVVDLVNHFKAKGVAPDKVYLNKKDLNVKSKDEMSSMTALSTKAHDKVKTDKPEEKMDLPEKVASLSNRFKTYGEALDYVYRDTLKKKKEKEDDVQDMSDSENSNVESKKKKLARLSDVLRNHKGNLNREDRPKLKAERKGSRATSEVNKATSEVKEGDKSKKAAIAIDVAESVSAAAPVYRVCKETDLKVVGRRRSSSIELQKDSSSSAKNEKTEQQKQCEDQQVGNSI